MTKSLFAAISILFLAACPSRNDHRTSSSKLVRSHGCDTVDEILDKVANFALHKESDLGSLAATAEDLSSLQDLPLSSDTANRLALNDQLRTDIIKAVSAFRETNKPTGVVRKNSGELQKAAPIENIAPKVDQMRDAGITFSTPGGEKSLQIGVLVNIDGCWKILYV